jgi:hypothetical protein
MIIAFALLVALVALRWHTDDEDERREAGARPTPWLRQLLQVGFGALMFVVALVIVILWFLWPTLLP